jgi:hypothetical protein
MPARCVLPLLLLSAIVVATPAPAGPASASGEHDIEVLIQRAGKAFELDEEDAVFLFDAARDAWSADGRRVRSVHRIVYIRTGHAIRSYADLRVPYDASRQRLTVTALRTWRLSDRQWIDSGPTAQVDTLPFALDRAPDYAGRREMMLLHDGVELPCVLETAYAIEDIEPYRAGGHGLWTFARGEPTVVSRLVLGFPAGSAPSFAASTDVPEPVRGRDEALGLETLAFEMGPVEPSPYPPAPEPLVRDPHVTWSTFGDWASLGRQLQERFTAAQELTDEARDRLAEHLETARTAAERARLVAGFVADSTRLVDYESDWWPAPRRAKRTWETAYGSRLDRIVLAAALYREAGLEATLAFRGRSFGDVDVRVPNLRWTDGPGLRIAGEGIEGSFDPVSSEFTQGPSAWLARADWRPATDEAPSVGRHTGDAPSRLEVRLDLHYDSENERWKGNGVLTATFALCPFEQMTGLESEARDYLGSVAGAVLDGAEITGYNPESFDPSKVTVGFEIEAPVGERDALDRLQLRISDPEGLSPLFEHAAIHVHEERRGSDIVLPTAIEQRLKLHLDTGDLEVVRLPAPSTSANDAGRFVITADEIDGEVVLTRDLSLAKSRYAPEEWPALRLLLLADGREGNRLVLMK